MDPKEKKAFEPTGLVPRSIVRTFERFRQQLLPGSERAAIREYRISRYQVLVSARCLFALLTIPIATNWFVSSWLLSPIIEHYWNTQQNEIFLNSYQEERAFAELEFFSDKLFFESLLGNQNDDYKNLSAAGIAAKMHRGEKPATIETRLPLFYDNFSQEKKRLFFINIEEEKRPFCISPNINLYCGESYFLKAVSENRMAPRQDTSKMVYNLGTENACLTRVALHNARAPKVHVVKGGRCKIEDANPFHITPFLFTGEKMNTKVFLCTEGAYTFSNTPYAVLCTRKANQARGESHRLTIYNADKTQRLLQSKSAKLSHRRLPRVNSTTTFLKSPVHSEEFTLGLPAAFENSTNPFLEIWNVNNTENSVKIKSRIQEKIVELAVYYNEQTILSITNIAGDFISVLTLGCLFIWMKPEISILKSFLIEAIYSLSDTTKSFLLILLTDLLVGFHSPRGWETALELLLKHFGLPENQDFVFLFVATFPVLLDTVFKYWIFRHLNKISPSTVATYHSMIE